MLFKPDLSFWIRETLVPQRFPNKLDTFGIGIRHFCSLSGRHHRNSAARQERLICRRSVAIKLLSGLVAGHCGELLRRRAVLSHRAQRGLAQTMGDAAAGQAGLPDRITHQPRQHGALYRLAAMLMNPERSIGSRSPFPA